MQTLWFCIVALMLAAYVILDGFDIGAGIVHLGVARTDAERRQVLRSIGPVWDGNEVWLLAAGGTLYFAFPALYAAGFAGFYLPLMIVLWLLILRGVSIEFRGHIDSLVWKPLWDAGFSLSSALLAIFFGAALGNVIRGVPFDANGEFFLPLWTHFGVSGPLGILDWYTILTGLLAYLALTMHGALWVAYKTGAAVAARARHIARWAWWGVAAATAAVTFATFQVQPQLSANLSRAPWGYLFPTAAIAALIGSRRGAGSQPGSQPAASRLVSTPLAAFLCSSAYLASMLCAAAFGLYPYVLPATAGAAGGLTIYNAAAARYGLQIGLIWWVLGAALATAYFVFIYRHFAGPVELEETEGY
jgi:cytochrome bd ubiquinol oxidase subunit II